MRFVLSKVPVALGTLMFVLVFNFFLFRIAGDPIKDLIRGNPHLTEQGRERLIKQRGLRDSYITQFRIYVDEVLHGDLGTSFQTNQPVCTMIRAALPNTLILVGTSTHPGGDHRHLAGHLRGRRNAGLQATPASSRDRCSSTRCRTSGPA